jgi:hypothetical protein
MTDARYFHFCSHEQFPPDELLEQAVLAERAGFDAEHVLPQLRGARVG